MFFKLFTYTPRLPKINFSEIEITGGKKVNITLPIPEQRSTTWHTMKRPYYENVVVYMHKNNYSTNVFSSNLYSKYYLYFH